jgi:diguanylate cyclase (GGDEF)-like protein/PAS domain S-box-containing protein
MADQDDCNALLRSAFDSLPDGVAVFDPEGAVALWNAAAEAITGYSSIELEHGALPAGLMSLIEEPHLNGPRLVGSKRKAWGSQARTLHKLGHEVPVIARSLKLVDGLGGVSGTMVLFHPAERLDALPHGETSNDASVAMSQAEFEERLRAEFDDFARGGQPLGVLWISIDQAHELRRTHGAAACHAMLDKVQHALGSGLRPAEELGRWGEEEFLVITHERTAEMLDRHARTLAGLARTADFRWWGDRVSLTVSIGAVQADRSETLTKVLARARRAAELGMREGGNRVIRGAREQGEIEAEGEEPVCTPL